MSITRLKNLLPQLINSAQILCSFPTSKKAQENMEMYRKAWLNELKLLYLAIDDITSVNDFLTVSEAKLLEDINKCISALTSFDAVCFEHTAQQVASRVVRICNVVNYEMFNYEPCDFTKKVLDSVFIIKSTILNNFVQTVEFANKALKSQPIKEPNENEFIDASRQIYYSIRDLRNALLLIPQENDSDNMFEVDEKEQPENVEEKDVDEEEVEVSSETPLILNHNITQEQKEQINQHLDLFHEEKNNFDREVLKWDDTSNDIVVLAKQMSVIMMDMTNFTRGKGPYKRISDVIAAAKKISEIGTKLEKLVKDLASQCPESPTKVELLSYLNKIPLFCNQLNIGSKVKENVIDVKLVFKF
jgi:catenin alpha